MNRFYTFFTDKEGHESLGGSHYDFERMCDSIELFLEINQEREFAFVSACRIDSSGHIEEVVRWKKGNLDPIIDKR